MDKKMNKRATVFALCWTALAGVLSQERIDLDLTRNRPAQREAVGGGSVSRSGSGHGTQPVVPIKVTLISLNAPRYRLGDTVVYDIEIENISRDVIVLPWSMDRDRVRPNEQQIPSGYRSASTSLLVGGPGNAQNVIAANGVYASD